MPAPFRKSVPKDKFSSIYSTLKTQTYFDPASRSAGSHQIRSLSWSPLGNLIATGSVDKTVRVWNPEKPEVKNSTELRGHNSSIEKVAFNPEVESQLCTVGSDGVVKFWDVRSKNCTNEVKTGEGLISLAWRQEGDGVIVGTKAPNGTRALSQQLDKLIEISPTSPQILSAHQQDVQTNQVFLTYSGDQVFMTTGDGKLNIAAYPSFNLLHTIHAHTSACLSVELDPTAHYIAIGGSDALISLWDTHDFICKHGLDRMAGPVRSVSFSFDGSYVVGGSDEGTGLEIAHSESGEYVHSIPTNHPAPFVAFHPHRYLLAYSGDPAGLKITGAAGGAM
ncbi:MAG: hypothetical protein M1829_000138 [Trizodia sp. TS-e1964]|nr:MAG: hypothetical protein M1829_000138 [Trizodia sp. TS-e1964]